MRINLLVPVNDDTIRRDVLYAISDYEEEFNFKFPSNLEKSNFIDDCIDTIIENYENAGTDYHPDYAEFVADMLECYGY